VRLSLAALALASVLLGCSAELAAIRTAAARGDIARASRLYHTYIDRRGYADPEALVELSREVLRQCATSDDARVRAVTFNTLRTLGEPARPILEVLTRRDDASGDRAAAMLYELDGRDRAPPPRLRTALESDDLERRLAGLSSLRGRTGAHRLAELSRDAEPKLRLAAVVALGAHGADAVEALRAALTDADARVRMVTPGALMTASPSAAVETLAPLVVGEVSALSIESARVLAAHGDARGVTHILAALQRGPDELRAQAASAAASLPRGHESALAPFMSDRVPEVAVAIASVLVRRDTHRVAATMALHTLSARPESAVSLRASMALAVAGDDREQRVVAGAMWSSDAALRRMAVGVWTRIVGAEASGVDPLALLLTDSDRGLAAMAAAGVLTIVSRR
jgi:hypothetical protein